MKTLIAALTILLNVSAFANETSANHPCAEQVVQIGESKMFYDLTADERKLADIELVELDFRYSLESFPTQEVFEVTLESHIPGWAKYEVVVKGDSCELLNISVIEEE